MYFLLLRNILAPVDLILSGSAAGKKGLEEYGGHFSKPSESLLVTSSHILLFVDPFKKL